MEKLLSELKPQDSGTVKRVTGAGALRRRLFDMGVTPSANVVMRKAAPLGDPIEVTLRGYEPTLRKTEAECVIVEIIPN